MRTTFAVSCVLLLLAAGCGGAEKGAESPDGVEGASPADTETAKADAPPTPGSSEHADAPPAAELTPEQKRQKLCTGFELDLAQALLQSACEVPNAPSDQKNQDTKGKLEVRVVPSIVTFVNKTAQPLSLDFVIDPTPRFQVEAFGQKSKKRVDLPAGNEPPPPKGAKRPDPTPPQTARVTLVAHGTAKMVVPWEAVRTKWAPERYKGTPPEMGYPRAPAGPLPKGKYDLKVITPLTNVMEGLDKEVSSRQVEITVQ
jgi:hypothetical protein